MLEKVFDTGGLLPGHPLDSGEAMIKTLGIITGLLATLVGVAEAQVKYVDDKGATHWVQSVQSIPEQYRDNAAKPSLNALPNANVAPQKSTSNKDDNAYLRNVELLSDLNRRIRAADVQLDTYKRVELEQKRADVERNVARDCDNGTLSASYCRTLSERMANDFYDTNETLKKQGRR